MRSCPILMSLLLVFPRFYIAVYFAPSTSPLDVRPPPSQLWSHKPPPGRPDADHLCAPCELLRRDSIHTPLPHCAVCSFPALLVFPAREPHIRLEHVHLPMVPLHNHNFKGNVLPCTPSNRALPISGVISCRRGRMGCGNSIQTRHTTWCQYLADTRVDGGRGEEEGV